MRSSWRHLKAAGSSLLSAAGRAGHALAGPFALSPDAALPAGFYEWRGVTHAPYVQVEHDGARIAGAAAHGGIAQGVLELPSGAARLTATDGATLTLRRLGVRALAARTLTLTANRRAILSRWGREGRVAAARALLAAGRGANVDDYQAWIAAHETPHQNPQAIATWVKTLPDLPLISVVTPVYETPPEWLRACLASVQAQAYPHWEHCLAEDASPSDSAFAMLQEATADPRVRVMRRDANGGIAAATNNALTLARGTWIAFLDHDDTLSPDALALAAAAITANPDAQIIYTDEDKIDETGARNEPFMKGGWNPSLFAAQNYLNHLTLIRRDLIDAVGGLKPGFDGSQDYDLLLRCTARITPAEIVHVPAVAYHWRFARGGGNFSVRQAERTQARMHAAYEANATNGAVLEPAADGLPYPRLRPALPTPAPLVSLIIPSRDAAGLLARCVETLTEKASWPQVEVIVMDNDSRAPDALALLARLQNEGKARVAPFPGAFNFSAINNSGAKLARGVVLGFVNNDIEAQSSDWLAEMLRWFSDPGVAAVGPKLLYPDGRVQHAGLVTGIAGSAGHLYKYREGGDPGPFAQLARARDVSALTAACLLVRADAFHAVGGFDESAFPVAFNDVDLCLKLRTAGHRLVWTPDSVLIHHESASRGSDTIDATKRARFAAERDALRARWGETLDADPYYSANLTLADESGALAWPPRWRRPWA